MGDRKWHVEHMDGRMYAEWELELATPYELAVPVLSMDGELLFADRSDLIESDDDDMVVVWGDAHTCGECGNFLRLKISSDCICCLPIFGSDTPNPHPSRSDPACPRFRMRVEMDDYDD